MAKILTVSLNVEAEELWIKVRDTGIGPSKFMRDALDFYVENGYRFRDVPVVKKEDVVI